MDLRYLIGTNLIQIETRPFHQPTGRAAIHRALRDLTG